MKRALVSIVLVVMSLSAIRAEVKLETEISDSTLTLGDEITVQLKVDGAKGGVNLKFPEVDGLSFRQMGPPSSSSRTIIVNGKVSRFNGLVYTVGIGAQKIGNFVIPGFRIEHQGKVYTDRPFRLRVVAPDAQSAMKLTVDVSSNRTYLHEPLLVTLKWYLQDDIEDYTFRLPLLALKDEIQLQLAESKGSGTTSNLNVSGYTIPFGKSNENLDGEFFTVYSVRFQVYPVEPGPFRIAPASVKAMVKRGSEMRRDFFGRLRRSPKLERIFATSKAVVVEVLPLPEDDRPATFTGAVGEFSVQLATEAGRVKVGDPVELSIRITGKGRLEKIEQPILSEIPEYQQNFVAVDNLQPGDIQENSIVFKQIVRPRHEQVTRIPPVTFSYFSPLSRKYITIKSNSLPLRVLPTRKVAAEDIVVHGRRKSDGIGRYVKKQRGIYANYTFEDALESQKRHWSWFLLLILPPLAYLTCLLTVSRLRRLENDQALVRSKSARGVRNKRLKKAGSLIQTEGNEFFQELSQALSGYIADRLNLGTGELTTLEVRKLGEKNRLPADLAADVSARLETFDRLRFTSRQTTKEERQKIFDEVAGLIKALGKRL